MIAVSEIIERLETLVHQEETYDEACRFARSAITQDLSGCAAGEFAQLLQVLPDVIDNPDGDDFFDIVTDWAHHIYARWDRADKDGLLTVADALADWLNVKLEVMAHPERSREARLSLTLFEELQHFDRPAEYRTSALQGFSTYALMVGLAESDAGLVERGITAQRQVLDLYETGVFPEYYNIPTFVLSAKAGVAAALMDAHESGLFDGNTGISEARALLAEVHEGRKTCGTDFDRMYCDMLLDRHDELSS